TKRSGSGQYVGWVKRRTLTLACYSSACRRITHQPVGSSYTDEPPMPYDQENRRIANVSDLLDRQRQALPHTDTHGREAQLASGFLQRVHGGHDLSRATHAQRVPKGDSATLRVDLRAVVSQAEVTHYRQA